MSFNYWVRYYIYKSHTLLSTMDNKSQLQQLLKASDRMRDSLQSLKHNMADGNLSHISSTNYLLEAMDNRQILRKMAETLERNRRLLQYNKAKYERSRTFLEGLEYYKATIKDKIKDYEIDLEDPSDHIEEHIGEIDWENGYEEGEQKIKGQLQKIMDKTNDLKSANTKKKELEQKVKAKKKLFKEIIPSHVRRLNEEVLATCKVFGIENEETLEDISNKKLAKIWDTLKPQQKRCSISMKYSNEEYQSILLTLKPCQIIPESICKGKSSFFNQQSLPLPISFEQKEINFQILYLQPLYTKVVVGVDRHCGFSNIEIFNRLINDEQVKPIFVQPEKQIQRNINAKYIQVDWIQNMMVSDFVEDALMMIRYRIMVLQAMKSLVQSLNTAGEKMLNQSKINIKLATRINFDEYLKNVTVPEQVSRSINLYKLMKVSAKDSSEKITQHYRSLETLLTQLRLEELLIPNINRYYKVTVGCQRNNKYLKFSLIIIVPYQYPRKASSIKIVEFKLNNLKLMPPSQQLSGLREIKNYDGDITDENEYRQEIEVVQNESNYKLAMELEQLSKQIQAQGEEKNFDSHKISRIFIVYLQIRRALKLTTKLGLL